jgi:hypothetical protein
MTHDSRGKAGRKTTRRGSGPTLAKHQAAEKGRVIQASLIWVCRSRPSKRCILDSGPPPPLKGRNGGGVQNGLHRCLSGHTDLSRWRGAPPILDPPPPLKGRKARGVRNPIHVVDLDVQIWTARTCSLLTIGALSPTT